MLSFNDIHQYVFGDRARINDLEININAIPEEERETKLLVIQEKRLAKIRKDIAQKFKPIIDKNPKQFRRFLRQVGSKDLEEILFHEIEETNEKVIKLPTEEEITEKFFELNNNYRFFYDSNDNNNLSNAEVKNFIPLFQICKFIADFVECNNNAGNEVAYEHAYKLLVLIGISNVNDNKNNPFSQIEKFIKTHNVTSFTKPVHDMLVNAIPINSTNINLSAWRKLILKHGMEPIKLFQMANDLNAHIEINQSTTLAQIKKAVSKIHFTRFDEYPELAILCRENKVREEVFNHCLGIEKHRKNSDLLPNLVIDGSELGHEGYHLVKLPINDPRTYILGKLTDCCQSVGDNSERCVIDGLTRQNNAFYVLLKDKKPKGEDKKLDPDKQINYDRYEIVGTGYAWLSTLGNLCFDSWENLRPQADDQVAFDLINRFGERATHECENIVRVTIGTGGKTPKLFNQELDLTEKMREGYQYGDSISQALVSVNTKKQADLYQKLLALLYKLESENIITTAEISLISQLFEQDKLYSMNFIDYLEQVLRDKNKSFINLIHEEESLNRLQRDINKNGPVIWIIFFQLLQADLFKKELINKILNALFVYPEHSGLSDAISYLKEKNLLSINNLTKLIAHLKYADEFSEALKELNSADLLNQSNFDNLIQVINEYNAHSLSGIFNELNEAKILTPNNFDRLIHKNDHLILYYDALYDLNAAKILNQSIFDLIMDSQGPIAFKNRLIEANQNQLLNIIDIDKVKLKNLEHLDFFEAIFKLVELNLLNESTLQVAYKESARTIKNLAFGLEILNNASLLKKYEAFLITNCCVADVLAKQLIMLDRNKLIDFYFLKLSDLKSKNHVAKHNELTVNLASVMVILSENIILIDNYIDYIMSTENPIDTAKMFNAMPKQEIDRFIKIIEESQLGILTPMFGKCFSILYKKKLSDDKYIGHVLKIFALLPKNDDGLRYANNLERILTRLTYSNFLNLELMEMIEKRILDSNFNEYFSNILFSLSQKQLTQAQLNSLLNLPTDIYQQLLKLTQNAISENKKDTVQLLRVFPEKNYLEVINYLCCMNYDLKSLLNEFVDYYQKNQLEDKDYELLEIILKEINNITKLNEYCYSIFATAIHNQNVKLVEILLSNSLDPNAAMNKFSDTPTNMAVGEKSFDIFSLLLAKTNTKITVNLDHALKSKWPIDKLLDLYRDEKIDINCRHVEIEQLSSFIIENANVLQQLLFSEYNYFYNNLTLQGKQFLVSQVFNMLNGVNQDNFFDRILRDERINKINVLSLSDKINYIMSKGSLAEITCLNNLQKAELLIKLSFYQNKTINRDLVHWLIKTRKGKDIIDIALFDPHAALLLLSTDFGTMLTNDDRSKIILKWINNKDFAKGIFKAPLSTMSYEKNDNVFSYTLAQSVGFFSSNSKLVEGLNETSKDLLKESILQHAVNEVSAKLYDWLHDHPEFKKLELDYEKIADGFSQVHDYVNSLINQSSVKADKIILGNLKSILDEALVSSKNLTAKNIVKTFSKH